MRRQTKIVLLATLLAFGASACNTVKGAGRDVESVAKTTEEAVK